MAEDINRRYGTTSYSTWLSWPSATPHRWLSGCSILLKCTILHMIVKTMVTRYRNFPDKGGRCRQDVLKNRPIAHLLPQILSYATFFQILRRLQCERPASKHLTPGVEQTKDRNPSYSCKKIRRASLASRHHQFARILVPGRINRSIVPQR